MINLSLYHDKYLCECVDVSIGKSLEGKNEFSLQMTILEMLWPYNNCYILDFGVIYQKIQNLIDRMDVLKVCFFILQCFWMWLRSLYQLPNELQSCEDIFTLFGE